MAGGISGGFYGDPTNNFNSGNGNSEWFSKTVATKVPKGIEVGALTNLTGLIDAWGKPIPYTWGNIRVGGVGIWGSPYYELISKFETTTEFYNDYQIYDGVSQIIGGPAGELKTELTDTKITTSQEIIYSIDLAYSFGFEGSLTGDRLLSRLRVNGKLVYDKLTNYIEPGIGFSVRYGNKSDVINTIMAKYEDTGKYYYPGQTYVIFEKFPLVAWGNTLPTSIDAEFEQVESFGAAETILFPPTIGKVYDPSKMIYYPERRRVYYVDFADDGVTPVLHTFSLDNGARLENIPLSGPGMAEFVQIYSGQSQDNGINCGLFDCRIWSPGNGTIFAVDIRSGYVGIIAQDVFCHSLLLWTCNKDAAEVYHWRFVGPGSANRITLVRENGVIVTSFVFLEQFPAGVNVAYGYVDGDGNNFAVLSHTQGNGNNVSIWDGQLGPGIALDYGQDGSDAWRVVDVMAYNKQAYVLVSKSFDGSNTKLMRFNRAGILQQEQDMNIPGKTFNLTSLKGPHEGRRGIPGNTYIGGIQPGNGGVGNQQAAILNLKTMALVFFPAGPGIDNAPFDALSTKLYYSRAGQGGGETGLVGPGFEGVRISLFEFMKSLYVLSNVYNSNQIRQDGAIVETIQGAMIVNNIPVDTIVQSICTLYHINKVDTIDGVYLFKTRNTADGLTIALQLDIGDLAADPEETDESQILKTSRANVNLTPSQIDLRFLDPNNEYKENSVSWRRTNAGLIKGQVASLAVPIVMTQDEALKLVQAAVIDGESRVHSHTFRLAPRHALLVVPGDIIQITHGSYRETIQIVTLDLNGDYSGSCTGVTVVDENVVEIKTPVYVPPVPINLGETVDSSGYIIDSPTLIPIDDQGTGYVSHYLAIGPKEDGNYNGGYFGRRLPPDGSWESLPTVKATIPLTVYRTNAALTDKKWVIDSDPLPVVRLSGRNPQARTNLQLQADGTVNLAFYGAPGRWEIIQFERITGGAIVGIIRGLRGTEVFSAMHQIGDLVIASASGIIQERKAIDKVGIEEEYRPVSVGRPFGAAISLPTYTLKGLSAFPFMPASLTWTLETNGDITIRWERRDRLGTGWGASVLPHSDPREYRIAIYNALGSVQLRALEVIGAETVTYTVAMQTADGMVGSTFLNIAAAQKGQLGYGLTRVVKVNG